MARKKRGKPHEEEASEAWLLPYSDLMTLLLALFIALFAISQTDQTKMSQLAQAFTAAFNMGGPSFFNQAGPNPSMQRQIISNEDLGNEAFLKENQTLEEIQRELEEYIQQNNLQDQLSTQLEEDGLMIRIKEKALFPSGSADLVAESQRIGPIVAGLLASVPERVLISGHTDTDPISNARFPSNWELSSARAMTFMKYLLSINANLNPARFSAIGYGEYRPIAPNDTAEGKQTNRRVEILIARSLRFNPNEGVTSSSDNDLVAR
ncbi:MAG: OmpA family protein [Selenomonadaceae bacterium]|nr:OmpA family protein [Selenomonadaceae bacterium]MBR1859023.1 OmpA family protein [Selenomonadaceae bacterium]